MKSWHLTGIIILLIISLALTARLSDERDYSKSIAHRSEIPTVKPKEDTKELLEKDEYKEKPIEDEVLKEPRFAIVEIKDMGFVPRELTVKPNTTIIWQNKDWTGFYGRVHMVVSSTNFFRSSRFPQNDTYNFTFIEPGTYRYIDPIYRSNPGGGIVMKPGIIYVE